jgi:pyruvyl transferase EpsO
MIEGTDALIADINGQMNRALEAVIPAGAPVALLDFPNHDNVGDSAIWLGETEWLRRHGHPIIAFSELASYSPRRLRRALPEDAVIALQGGGNFGDIWPERFEFKETLLQDFPDRRIVQLPQTLGFRSPDAVLRAKERLRRHEQLFVLCRDETSLATARSTLGLQAELCPDMAFALASLPAPAAELPIAWLARTDSEATEALTPPPESGIEPFDWAAGVSSATIGTAWERRGLRLAASSRLLDRVPAAADRMVSAGTGALYERKASEQVARGCALLGRGQVVVSDRLHAHILCLLMRRAHVVVDTGYGKLASFVQRWTAGSPLVRVAASSSEALIQAEDLLGELSGLRK